MNKKKWIKIGLPVAAGCVLLAAGIGFAAKNSGKAVKVAPVSSLSSGGWYNESGVSDSGTVTTNQKQDIYPDDTLQITEVYVKAGDNVKVGDRLVAYDTTLSSLELEMKEMQIQGYELNIQNLQKEISQLKGTKTASAQTGQPEVQTMSAVKAVTPLAAVQQMAEKTTGTVTGKEGEETTETPSSAVERPFPEKLKGKEIYSEITTDSVPYNEDGEGTLEKPYRYLCAPGAAVHAKFMLKVLKEGIVCAFDVVDRTEEPTKFISCWVLDGKTGQVIIPEEPSTPEEPETPEEPTTPEEPETPEEPDIPDEPEEPEEPEIPDEPELPTKEEVAKEIQEKEQKIKELDLSKRTAQLELKKLQKKVGDGVIKSTVEGVVKEVTEEEAAKNESKPIVSVVGEEGFYVTGNVAESVMDQIEEGMSATVTSWKTGESYEATVTGVGNSPTSDYMSGDNQNQSYYPFTVVIQGDADLSNGESVNLSVEGMSSMDEDGIYLEQMFVREEGNQYYVYKRGENGRLQKQNVEVGKNFYGSLQIVFGLTAEDLIAFPYGRDVKEGAKTQETDSLYNYN